jgi:hypothetical protein
VVLAFAAIELVPLSIIITSTVQQIVATPTIDDILAPDCLQLVVAVTAVDDVVALVAEAGVERLDPGVLPGRARLDVGGAGAGDEATVAQGMGDETTPAPAGYPTLPDPTLIG